MSSMPTLPGAFMPALDQEPPDLLIIAGEHSGDEHAATMVRELLRDKPDLHIYAFGGPKLEAAGARLLFDMNAFSVVGLFEVLKHYGFFKELFSKTTNWIEMHRPKAICFVDYPGFNLRLAKELFQKKLAHKAGGPIYLYYYISPQIWAWKARRRFKMAKWLDALGVIIPFEQQCYRDTDLPVRFVGHPFVKKDYINNLSYAPDAPILLFPGSRKAPVGRIFPLMLEAFKAYLQERPQAQAVVSYPSDTIKRVLEEILLKYPKLQKAITLQPAQQSLKGSAVLMSSGTMSTKCALAGIPGAIVYRAHPLTYWIGRVLITIPYLGLANLILREPMYPEYIQHEAKAKVLKKCLEDARTVSVIEQTKHLSQKLYQLLDCGEFSSAASWLGSLLSSKEL